MNTLTRLQKERRYEGFEKIGFGLLIGFIACEFMYWLLVKMGIIEIIYSTTK